MRLEHEFGERLARDTGLRADELALDHVADDRATDAVVGLDARAQVTFWSSAAEKVYGIAATDALGSPFADLVSCHPDPGGLTQKHRHFLGSINLVNGPATH